jgi:uncharacterized membrane protein
MKNTALLLAGAGMMYFFDEPNGRRRRARLRDKLEHVQRKGVTAARTTRRDVVHRVRGLRAELSRLWVSDRPDSEVVAARVRAKLGHVCSHPGAIEVVTWGDAIGLRGHILSSELDRVVRAVQRVRGVEDVVTTDLIRHETADGISDLQGGVRRGGERFELLQRHWSPSGRLIAAIAGAGLTLAARRRALPLRIGLRTVGLAFLGRAVTNMEMRRLFGIGEQRGGIDVVKTITIAAPRHEVWSFFAALENFPKFMSHVRDVQDLGDGRYRWEVEGPAHAAVSWEAEVTRWAPNEALGWESLPGATIGNTGVVRFEDTDEGGTRVHIRLTYSPPAGAVGHFIAKLLRSDPKRELDDDMVRLKSLLEDGSTTVNRRKVRRDDLTTH